MSSQGARQNLTISHKREEQSGVIHSRKNRIEKLHHMSSLNSPSNKRLYTCVTLCLIHSSLLGPMRNIENSDTHAASQM
jgi:hypothetical protein